MRISYLGFRIRGFYRLAQAGHFCNMPSIEDIVKNNVVVWLLGMLFAGFLAGIGTYQAIIEIAHLKVISLAKWETIQSYIGENPEAEVEARQTVLGKEEQILLRELVSESKGLGDGVAVYPFKSNVRRIGMSSEAASTTIASLQERGFVVLEEEAGYDDLNDRPSAYPVYRVTKKGFLWVIQNNR